MLTSCHWSWLQVPNAEAVLVTLASPALAGPLLAIQLKMGVVNKMHNHAFSTDSLNVTWLKR